MRGVDRVFFTFTARTPEGDAISRWAVGTGRAPPLKGGKRRLFWCIGRVLRGGRMGRPSKKSKKSAASLANKRNILYN